MYGGSKLETISDADGAVRLGWLAEHVLFAHFRGKLAGVAVQYAELITEMFPRRYSARVLCDGYNLDATLRSTRFALKPLFDSDAAPTLHIQLLTRSRLVMLTASSLALLSRTQLEIVHSKREFRDMVRLASGRPGRSGAPAKGSPVSSAPPAARPPSRRAR
jgi:hypothetical protein